MEWVTQLHDEGAPELDSINDFLQELRNWFKDTAQGKEAEAEILELKQKGHPGVCYRVLESGRETMVLA